MILVPPEKNPQIGIIMGSKTDSELMKPAADTLRMLNIPFEISVVSAHRT